MAVSTSSTKSNKSTVFIICPGVGHINRGYESFTMECFNALKSSAMFDLYLLKGGGSSSDRELRILCIQRNSKIAAFLCKLFKRETYWIEQLTFFLAMIPKLIKYKPAVVYYSDFILGTFLFHFGNFFDFEYKLLFTNGAPNGPPFSSMHHVQQLLGVYFNEGISGETNSDKQTLLPLGFDITINQPKLNESEKTSLREKLGLPIGRKIIISVGAINAGHKRMDYVINEFSKLDQSQYFLILLGQVDEKSQSVQTLAKDLLPLDNYIIKSVPSLDVPFYLSVSDYFVLASLKEGFGRVLVEALQYGLVPIVHDYAASREVLQSYGVFVNMNKDNILAKAIGEVDDMNFTYMELWSFAYNTYSWDKLKERYSSMITKLL